MIEPWQKLSNNMVPGYTLKDIRPKAITDAQKNGFALEHISIAAVHSRTSTTVGYIKDKETPISEVRMKLPVAK